MNLKDFDDLVYLVAQKAFEAGLRKMHDPTAPSFEVWWKDIKTQTDAYQKRGTPNEY